MGSMLCTIESKDNLDGAVENFKKCLDSLQGNDCLLVDEFIDSSINDNCNLGARLRVLVTRRPNNVVETSGIICNLGYLDKPISGSTSKSFSIDYLCNVLQLTNDQKNQLIDKIKRLGEAVMDSIIDYETQHLTYVPQNKQTDFIGLDIFLKKYEGQLEPFLIEVNSHNCEGTLQFYEVQHSPNRTDILDKWVETMLYRSYQYMLKGKRAYCAIGGNGYARVDIRMDKYSQELFVLEVNAKCAISSIPLTDFSNLNQTSLGTILHLAGIPFAQLMSEIIAEAFARHSTKSLLVSKAA